MSRTVCGHPRPCVFVTRLPKLHWTVPKIGPGARRHNQALQRRAHDVVAGPPSAAPAGSERERAGPPTRPPFAPRMLVDCHSALPAILPGRRFDAFDRGSRFRQVCHDGESRPSALYSSSYSLFMLPPAHFLPPPRITDGSAATAPHSRSTASPQSTGNSTSSNSPRPQ